MRGLFVLLLLFPVVVGCGRSASPEEAARDFLQAFAQGDLEAVERLGCKALLSRYRDAARQLVDRGGSMRYDFDYDLESVDGNEARVRITGQSGTRRSPEAAEETQDVDKAVRLVREGGAWRYCER